MTGMVLIIQMINGIKRLLTMLIGDPFVEGDCVNRPEDMSRN